MDSLRRKTVNISSSTIFRTILIVLAFLFLFFISDIILVVFLAFVIVSAVSPLVSRLEKMKVPRVVSTVFIYLAIFLGFGYLVSLAIPPIVWQTRQLLSHLPQYWENIINSSWMGYLFSYDGSAEESGKKAIKVIGENLSFSKGIFSRAGSFFMQIFYLAVVFSLSFYMTIQKNALKKFIKAVVPGEHQKYVISLVSRIQSKLGHWLQGQIFLNFAIGLAVYLVLYLLGIPYALIIAVIAGVLEFIPNIGPVITTMFAALIAFAISPVKAIIVVAAFIAIQQLENHFLVPLVMRKAVGLNPVVVIVALLVGARLGGPIGAVMAVPIATALSVFVGDLFEKKKT